MIHTMSLAFAIRDAAPDAGREREHAHLLMNEEEFRAFYERTARPLWAYLSRIARDRHDADDTLQEAYYRFYRAGSTYQDEAHRRNALFRIATNIVRDNARRAKRHDDVPLEQHESESLAVPAANTPAPERQAEIRTDLGRAMTKLDPVQREMLWLAYAQGASHEEIAEILGLRTMSIKTLLMRARRKLAGILAAPEVRS
jgi:RNA polymerase sigma-70 factor (ECF subfamily)